MSVILRKRTLKRAREAAEAATSRQWDHFGNLHIAEADSNDEDEKVEPLPPVDPSFGEWCSTCLCVVGGPRGLEHLDHAEAKRNRPFPLDCRVCGEQFPTEQEYFEHCEKHHPDEPWAVRHFKHLDIDQLRRNCVSDIDFATPGRPLGYTVLRLDHALDMIVCQAYSTACGDYEHFDPCGFGSALRYLAEHGVVYAGVSAGMFQANLLAPLPNILEMLAYLTGFKALPDCPSNPPPAMFDVQTYRQLGGWRMTIKSLASSPELEPPKKRTFLGRSDPAPRTAVTVPKNVVPLEWCNVGNFEQHFNPRRRY